MSEAIFGAAMAGVLIAWNMGPVTFAPAASLAATYMMIHVALVGVRAAICHPLGGWISAVTGDPRWVFGLGCLLFVAASVAMRRLELRLRTEPQESSDASGHAEPGLEPADSTSPVSSPTRRR